MASVNNSISTIDRVNQQLASEESSISGSNKVTGFLGIVLIVAVFGYLFWGTQELMKFINPKDFFDLAEGQLNKQIDALQKKAETMIDTEKEVWAANLSKELQNRIPEYRPQIENFIMDQIKEQVLSGQKQVEPHLHDFISKNKAPLKDGLSNLKGGKKTADQFVESLVPLIEENVGGDLKTSVDDVLHGIMDMRAKVSKLADKNAKLNDIEALEQRAFMIVRRMQLKQADPSLPHKEAVDVKKRDENKSDGSKKAS